MEGTSSGAAARAPILTKVYRCGPGRQRLCKGYVVAGADARRVRDAVIAACQPMAQEQGLVLRVYERLEHALWLDTGLVWLHSKGERERLAQQLGRVVSVLAECANNAGALLLPSSVRLTSEQAWSDSICGDEHYIETSNEREKTAYCNLLRTHLPELIALTGRSGAGPGGVEKLCSRRLADSDRHIPARQFVSLAPSYLSHVIKALVRDEGVRRLDLLDVDPRVAGSAPSTADATVALRFVDGQVSIRSALAHALLFEALLIRAKRLVAQGKALPPLQQRDLERNRSSAIAHGLDAQLQTLVYGSKKRDKFGSKAGQGRKQNGKQPTAPEGRTVIREAARDALKRLLDSLGYEFQALEAASHEISPLLLGVSLRSWGVSGLQNENDLLRLLLADAAPEDAYERLRAVMTKADPPDPITDRNRRLFPKQVSAFEAEWKGRLIPKPKATTAAPPARDAATKAAPSAEGAATAPPVRATAGGERAKKRAKLRQAIQRLQQQLSRATPAVPLHRVLSDFAQQSGAKDIARALKVLSEQDGENLLRRLTERAPVYELTSDSPSSWTWDGQELESVRRQTHERAVLRFSTAAANESMLDSAVQKLLNTDAANWMLVVLDRRRDATATVAQRELLLVSPEGAGRPSSPQKPSSPRSPS